MNSTDIASQTTTKIYSYAAKPRSEDKPILAKMLTGALVYKNAFIAIERDRRCEQAALTRARSGPIRKFEKRIDEIDVEIAALTKKQRQANSSRGLATKKIGIKTIQRSCHPQTRAELKKLRVEKKSLKVKVAAAKKHLRTTNKSYRAEREKINERYNDKCKVVRKASTVYPPTKDLIEKDVKAAIKATQRPPVHAKPSKKRWIWEKHPRFVDDPKRKNRIGDRYTKSGKGISTDDVVAGSGKLSVELRPSGVWEPGTRRPRKLGTAITRIRLQSIKRKPIVYEIPIKMHRPLPPGAIVKQATLVRYFIGTSEKWQLQFCVAETNLVLPHEVTSVVGLDLGWRIMPDGRLRVGMLADDIVAALPTLPSKPFQFVQALELDGQTKMPTGTPVEIALPPEWMKEIKTVERIQSNRDNLKNQLQASLIAFKDDPGCSSWLAHILKHVGKWKARDRYLKLYAAWQNNRSKGDSVAFGAVEAWAKRDKHLWSYEANLRDQLHARRMHHYRNVASQLAQNYQAVILEGAVDTGKPMDLMEWQMDLPVEEAARQAKVDRIKTNMKYACLHSLRRALEEKLKIIVVDPKNTSKTCSWCGSDKKWRKPSEVMHKCSGCGRKWDRDVNAARNLVLKHHSQALATANAVAS